MAMDRPRLRLGTTLACAVAASLCVAVGLVEAQQDDAFTREEQNRIRAGELVARNVTRREGRFAMRGGTSWQLVHAPVDQVWAAVTDTRAYPHLIPALERARLVSQDGDERVVHMQHRYSFATASYFARVRLEPQRYHMSFTLDRTRPHDLRAGRGFITLSAYEEDNTIVTWGVLADIGGGAVLSVFGPLVDDWLLKVPLCVRNHVEPGRPGC